MFVVIVAKYKLKSDLCPDQLETSTSPPPPWQSPGIWTLEDWIVQIPAPSGQNSVQMPYPILEFVCAVVGSCRP